MSRRVFLPIALLMIAACACDRRPAAPAATTAPTPPALELELKPVTPLLPSRPTHVTIDSLGNIYWIQEGDRGDDTMFVIGQGDIPRATQLSVVNIAAGLGAAGAKGNIHDIAAGPSGEIYFYFSGTQGRQTAAAIGSFDPKTAQVRVLADAETLATTTGMGRSLPLARGTVVCDARNVWIWLHHSDDWAMFRVDPRTLAGSGGGPVSLTRAFESVNLAGQQLALTRDEYQLCAAPGGMLFLLDPVGGRLLRIAPDGQATVVRSLAGLPVDLSTPAVDRNGRILLFAANAELIKPQPDPAATGTAAATAPPQFDASFPAMLLFDSDGRVNQIGRDNMQAYPGFPIFGMRLRQLVPHPREEEWISYDAGSGELLHVRIREKSFR